MAAKPPPRATSRVSRERERAPGEEPSRAMQPWAWIRTDETRAAFCGAGGPLSQPISVYGVAMFDLVGQARAEVACGDRRSAFQPVERVDAEGVFRRHADAQLALAERRGRQKETAIPARSAKGSQLGSGKALGSENIHKMKRSCLRQRELGAARGSDLRKGEGGCRYLAEQPHIDGFIDLELQIIRLNKHCPKHARFEPVVLPMAHILVE